MAHRVALPQLDPGFLPRRAFGASSSCFTWHHDQDRPHGRNCYLGHLLRTIGEVRLLGLYPATSFGSYYLACLMQRRAKQIRATWQNKLGIQRQTQNAIGKRQPTIQQDLLPDLPPNRTTAPAIRSTRSKVSRYIDPHIVALANYR